MPEEIYGTNKIIDVEVFFLFFLKCKSVEETNFNKNCGYS